MTHDHGLDVDTWVGQTGGGVEVACGIWHYTQGMWRACDAAAKLADDTGSHDPGDAADLCGDDPTPEIYHSVGLWGMYAWIDETNGIYGVFVHSWAYDANAVYWINLSVVVVMAVLGGVACVPAWWKSLHCLKRSLLVLCCCWAFLFIGGIAMAGGGKLH